MNDFLKIFAVLSLTVGAFMYGRSYGETTYRQNDDKALRQTAEELRQARSELENIKAKFQNIADTADNKKNEELLTQILDVFVVDLGLKVQKPKAFVKETTPAPSEVATQKNEEKTVKATEPVVDPRRNVSIEAEASKKESAILKLKSREWILANSEDSRQARNNLKFIEIKNLNEFFKTAEVRPAADSAPIYGTYRGQILDVENNQYGSLLVDLKPITSNGNTVVKGKINIFRDGKTIQDNSFMYDSLGASLSGSEGTVISIDRTFWHLVKIRETGELAGYLYERNNSGKTRTIGSFLLKRTDLQ